MAGLMTLVMAFTLIVPGVAWADEPSGDTEAGYEERENYENYNNEGKSDGEEILDPSVGGEEEGDEVQKDEPAAPEEEKAEPGEEEADGEEPASEEPAEDPSGETAKQASLEGVSPVDEGGTNAGTTLSFKNLWDVQVASLKLYAYENGQKTGEDLLKDQVLENEEGSNAKKYPAISLDPGTYWLEGYDVGDATKEIQPQFNGGITITVAEGENVYTISRAYDIFLDNQEYFEDGTYRSFEYGKDYTFDLTITDSLGNERVVQGGKDYYMSDYHQSCIFIVGDTVKVTFRAIDEMAEKYQKSDTQSTTTSRTEAVKIKGKLTEAYKLTVKAPAGSTISAGRLYQYYTYEFSEAFDVAEDGSEASFWLTRAHGYEYGNSDMHFVRVQHPEGVTYWDFGVWNLKGTVEVTAKDLNIGGKYTSKTITRDFSDNIFDTGNIYLGFKRSGNSSSNASLEKADGQMGWISLSKNGTREINVWRNWQAKDTYWPTKVALPDVHYQVFNVNSDGTLTKDTDNSVIKITTNENHTSQATITGMANGTAVVLVTYDAVTHSDAMAKVGTERVTFSAIWPEHTGVFVVTVGSTALTQTDVPMQLSNLKDGSMMNLDSELDVLFYTGDEGAEFTFSPKYKNHTVTVARSTVSDTGMSFSGFTSEGVTEVKDANGYSTFTISGLTTGRHIVKVVRGDGRVFYQVITAQKASYTITHKNGTEVTATNPAKPGETLTIQYEGIYNPMEHLAGVYNNAPGIWLRDEFGNTYNNDVSMLGGYYDFSSNATRHKLTITVPTYVTENSYTIDGTLHMTGFGNAKGGHRNHSYNPTSGGSGNAPNSDHILTRLPQVTVAVVPATAEKVTLKFKDDQGHIYNKNNLTSVVIKGSSGRSYDITDEGELEAVVDQYTYEISGTGVKFSTGTFVIDGSREEIELTLTASSQNAWDGSTLTEPQQVDGVYQIGTGAELAWFSNQNMQKKDVTGKLMADIDLADYTWNNGYLSVVLYDTSPVVVLEGDGHTISGLNASNSLFYVAVNGSKISNLTVKGQVNTTGQMQPAGGIVAYGIDLTVENCKSEVKINNNPTNNQSSNTGGIVGKLAYSKAISKIVGCVNTGEVYTKNSDAGGIVGNVGSVYATIDSCYNTGKVTSGSVNCGGIVGSASGKTTDQPATIQNCYNTGVAAKGIVGSVGNYATFTECVYLNTLECTDTKGKAISEELLKGFAPAGSQLKLPCTGGNPVVSWELSGNAHSHGESDSGTVTANTCLADGYTTYRCTNCQQDYKTDITYTLGHEMSETVAEDHPAYTMNQCVRYGDCGHLMKKWKDNNFQYMTISDSDLKDLSLTLGTTGTGTWAYDLQTGKFTGGKSSTANQTLEFTFTVDKTAVLGFGYGYSATSASQDSLSLTLTKTGAEDPVFSETLGGKTSDKMYRKTLEAGTYTLKAVYTYVTVNNTFGGGLRSNNDYGYLSNIELLAYENAADAEASLELFQQAQPVVEQIAALPAVSALALTDKAAVEAARAAYKALSDGAKVYVSNLSTLEALEARLKKLQTDADNAASTPQKMYVTFRLIGSTLAEEDVDLSEGLEGFHGAEYQTWIKTTKYEIQEGDVVADVFEQALEDHDLTYIGGRNWISAISAPEVLGGYMLYERQNGASSGWMYTYNGTHVNKTIDQQTLKNGDKIVFHYINDYNYEDDQWHGGSEGSSSTFRLWLKAPDVDPNKISGGSSDSNDEDTSAELNPTAVPDKNGEATVSVTASEIKSVVKNAKELGAGEIVIAPSISGQASKVTVNVPATSAQFIAKDAKADLCVKTDLAEVVIGTDDLSKVGTKGNLTISAEKQENGAVTITVTAGGEDVNLTNTTVAIPANSDANTNVLVLVKADGTEEVIKKCVLADGNLVATIDGSCTVKIMSVEVAFGDVGNHWGKGAVEFVAARNIFNGTGANAFAPNDAMNRSMVATVLYRLENEATTGGTLVFKDAVDPWAKEAVIWASEQGVVTGDEAGNFNGGASVTRQELATMLYRYAKTVGLDTSSTASLSGFTDGGNVADWAKEAMEWSVEWGLMQGPGDGTINPTGTATRAEVATVIMRLIELSVK